MGLSRLHRQSYNKKGQTSADMLAGRRIRQERKAQKLSQEELARQAGITQPSLSEIETGETKNLRGQTLLGIARALRLNTWWILTGNGQKFADKALSDQESALLGVFESLSDANRSAVIAAAISLYESQAQPAPPPPKKQK